MARAEVKDGLLRSCPLCGTPASEADLGLRDFRWVNPYLPGKVGLQDIDGLLDQDKTGRALVFEFKQKGAALSLGSRITFGGLRRKGFDVWVCWDLRDGNVEIAEYTWRLGVKETITKEQLGQRVRTWWDQGVMISASRT